MSGRDLPGHSYEALPAPIFKRLLGEVAADLTGIFWGLSVYPPAAV
jgi:hypothetical protein